MTDRLPCLVPFCRRTTGRHIKDGFSQWICPDHWRLASPLRKRLYRMLKARVRRYPDEDRWKGMAAKNWRDIVGQVIERAGGIR
jgi:hypothetical protein